MEEKDRVFAFSSDELAHMYENCDDRFRNPNNEWYQFASLYLFREGANTSNWVIKDPYAFTAAFDRIEKLIEAKDPKPNVEQTRMLTALIAVELEAVLVRPPKFVRKVQIVA